MYLPSFTLVNLLGSIWLVLSLFAIAKILTQDWKPHLKESIYFVVAAILAAIVGVISRDKFDTTPFFFWDMALLIVLFIYFRKFKGYSKKKSFILLSISIYILITITLYPIRISFHFLTQLDLGFWSDFMPVFSPEAPVLPVLQVLLIFPAAVLPAIVIVKLSRKARQLINQSNNLQSLIMGVIIIIFTLYTFIITHWRIYERTHGYSPGMALGFLPIGTAMLAWFYFYTRYVNAKHERQQKEADYKSLQYYTTGLEQYQAAILKFKHDNQNILMSMYAFIQEKDYTGLEQYFLTKILPMSETVTKNRFALQGLEKIKVREIKSIIAAKIMLAQSADADIDIKFEANEDIEHIPVDSVALVRMLGIILDNAVEALIELGSGKLFIAVQKWEAGITFTVQNTCGDMPPVYQVIKPGYSTKGANRGIGLSNLVEIVDANPNVMRETKIENGSFTQQLLIESEEETT